MLSVATQGLDGCQYRVDYHIGRGAVTFSRKCEGPWLAIITMDEDRWTAGHLPMLDIHGRHEASSVVNSDLAELLGEEMLAEVNGILT